MPAKIVQEPFQKPIQEPFQEPLQEPGQEPRQEPRQRLFQKPFQEPLVLFTVIAALLFGASALLKPTEKTTLLIDSNEVEARLFLEELNSGEPLSESKRLEITAAYIEEEALVIEAFARGLDNDSRIRSLLAQKMLHVMSAEIIQPSTAQLSDFFSANLSRYEQIALFDIEEVVLSRDDERTAKAALAAEPLLGRPLPTLSERDLASIFSAEFAAQVVNSHGAPEEDDWTGPFLSNRGKHWLRVVASIPETTPPFDEVAERVRLDWIAAEEETRQRQQVQKLVEQYNIVMSPTSSVR